MYLDALTCNLAIETYKPSQYYYLELKDDVLSQNVSKSLKIHNLHSRTPGKFYCQFQ